MTLSEELAWRGFINQTTLTDLKALDSQTWTFYHGFDASADSQAVGNLAAMMLDRAFMRHGHKAIILAGGATSLIGDPGGKDAERPLQSEETIGHNVKRAEEQMKRIFHGFDFRLVNNLDWTKDMRVIPYLRDIGKHFSMTPLIQRDYIAKRIGEDGGGISYAEFSYTILQGMDFLHLYDDYGCTLQLGGSDQWGNCLSGVELIRRARGEEAHVITLPLIINKATGKKFGKSEAGAVWLDADKTSPEDFYQFWINSDDEGVEGYLKIFTELEKDELDEVMSEFSSDHAGRAAQKRLAWEVTKLVHGEKAAEAARAYAESLQADPSGGEVSGRVRVGESIAEALYGTGLASSKSEARQLLADRGIYINDQQVDHETFQADDFKQTGDAQVAVLRRGKKLQNTRLVILEP